MQSEKPTASEEQSAISKLGAAIEQALDDAPVTDVLSVLTGAFVSLTLELVRRRGHDTNMPVQIDGGPNRDITIHAPKAQASGTSEEDAAEQTHPAH